ncbi:hypothetical protein COO60DRAFT_1638682 [Scenedesmus sp. NREL 46B-D3]|nr:hypothetical protein COO60DRAFT_1638682 [Scenedesmus sp. NREL 46B-D3]
MKPFPRLAALALALCLGCTLVAANDLQVEASVLDCYGKPVPNAVVRISGCVDDFGTGGISATTNSAGVASFLEGTENSIQYCWGSAASFCNFEVVSNPLGLAYTAQYDNGTERQEPSCTKFMTGPKLEFRPNDSDGTCAPPVNVGGETCFGWFKPTYNGKQDLTTVPVTSASFRADQKNDASNVLTSGIYSLSGTPTSPFAYMGNGQGNLRWGWEQLWNLPKGGAASTEAGFMFCGQNKYGGNIVATLTANSLTYDITMGPGTKFAVGDLHVYASCAAISGKNFAPGKLNCNPSKPSGCTTSGQLLSGGSQYKGTIMFGGCPAGQLFTVFHLGL